MNQRNYSLEIDAQRVIVETGHFDEAELNRGVSDEFMREAGYWPETGKISLPKEVVREHVAVDVAPLTPSQELEIENEIDRIMDRNTPVTYAMARADAMHSLGYK